MFCSKCKEDIPDGKELRHLREFHYGEKDLELQCPKCNSNYSTVPMFQKHWYSKHHTSKRPAATPSLQCSEPNDQNEPLSKSSRLEVSLIETQSPKSQSNAVVNNERGEPSLGSSIESISMEIQESSVQTKELSICDDVEVSCSSLQDEKSESESDASSESSGDDERVVDDNNDGSSCTIKEGVEITNDINKDAAAFILKLKDKCCVPASAIREILAETELLIKGAVSNFSNEVSKKLTANSVSLSEIMNVHDTIDSTSQVFNNLRSEHQQLKYFKESLGVVEPLRIPLGREFRKVRRKGQSAAATVPVTEDVMYVPVLDVIDKLINHPDYNNFVENGSLGQNSKFLDSYMQGEKCKTNSVLTEHPDALRLVLFYDDLEACSPLKSRSGKHKLAAFYMFLDNIPAKFRSNLSAIFLVTLVNANLIKDKKYGMDAGLEPLVKDLKKLEDGAVLKSGKKVYGTLVATIGDNLGLHTIGGFKEGFTAHKCCRFCSATYEQTKTMTREIVELLRDADSHNIQCAKVQTNKGKNEELSTKYGVNRNSILNTLKTFHVIGGLPPDLMHDIMEGLLPIAIKKLLRHYLYECKERKFTLDWLNQTIKDFDFGYVELCDKPSELKKDHIQDDSTTLHQSACQLWLLATVLPLILGPLVDVNDQHFINFLDLLEICRIVFSTDISNWMIVYLQDLIETYLTDYIALYGHLISKQHHLIHYPSQILLLGSLVTYMCLRCEAKHKFFKKLVNGLGNYKNIPWTLAMRHQLNQAIAWSKSLRKEAEYGPKHVCDIKEVHYRSLLPSTTKFVTETNWIQFDGNKFVPEKCFICFECVNDLPVFAKIVKVLISPSILFICQKVHTVEKDIHLAAYQITVSTELCVLQPNNMLIHSVLHAHKVNGLSYIALKYCAGGFLF